MPATFLTWWRISWDIDVVFMLPGAGSPEAGDGRVWEAEDRWDEQTTRVQDGRDQETQVSWFVVFSGVMWYWVVLNDALAFNVFGSWFVVCCGALTSEVQTHQVKLFCFTQFSESNCAIQIIFGMYTAYSIIYCVQWPATLKKIIWIPVCKKIFLDIIQNVN